MAGKVRVVKNKQEILQLIQFIGNRLVTSFSMKRTSYRGKGKDWQNYKL